MLNLILCYSYAIVKWLTLYLVFGKIPTGILPKTRYAVNDKIAICIINTDFENIDLNDILDNIRIASMYILQEKSKKFKRKK